MPYEPLAHRLPVVRSVIGLNDLFERVDDQQAFGEALANEELERAAEMAGVSEAELYSRFEVAERDGTLMVASVMGLGLIGLGLTARRLWNRLHATAE